MKATVIISVYKDAEALACILNALLRQSVKEFEVIIAEDGDDPSIRDVCNKFPTLDILHQTQEDIGFRKTKAVNKAILAARYSYIAFLDGDCVPHSRWLEMHVSNARIGEVLAARRLHLGRRFSKHLRQQPNFIDKLEALPRALPLLLRLQLDGARNTELCRPSHFLQNFLGDKIINLVGCNFSGFRDDLMLVNGYDESLPGIGGEDDDLHWRLEGVGIRVRNVKYEAIVYHLFHGSRRVDFELNKSISLRSIEAKQYYAINGILKEPNVQ